MDEGKGKSLGSIIDEILAILDGVDMSVRISALRAVVEHVKLPGIIPETREAGELSTEEEQDAPTDIRTFRDQKQPSTMIEMVCVIAYYLQRIAPASERKNWIDVNDITKYFVQAGAQLPKVGRQVLVDAKDTGYLDALGGGRYWLNAVGHNLVTHGLPRQAAKGTGVHRAQRAKAAGSPRMVGTTKTTR